MGSLEPPGFRGRETNRRTDRSTRRWIVGVAIATVAIFLSVAAVWALGPIGSDGASSSAQGEAGAPSQADSSTFAPLVPLPAVDIGESDAATTTLATTTTVAPSTTTTAAVLVEPVFAPTSPFNAPIPDGPILDGRSIEMARSLGEKVVADLYEFGIAIYEVDDATAPVSVECTEPWGTCLLASGLHRIPDGARPAPGSDGTLVVIDWSEGRTVELWQAEQVSETRWQTSWGTTTAIDGTGIPEIFGNGAGVSHLAGVIRTAEIEQGHIGHALAFSTMHTCRDVYRYPATKTDGQSSESDCIPEGARVQLDPSIDVDALDLNSAERMIARALQTYGAYAIDTGGSPMALYFEVADDATPGDPGAVYTSAGLTSDYFDLRSIPWERLRVLSAWDGT